jgi:hypothetical protein
VTLAGYCSSPHDLAILQFLRENGTNCDPNFISLYVHVFGTDMSVPNAVLIISIAGVAYFFRSEIRHCIFRWRVRKVTVVAPTGGERHYDAFVPYSNEDRHFVEQWSRCWRTNRLNSSCASLNAISQPVVFSMIAFFSRLPSVGR